MAERACPALRRVSARRSALVWTGSGGRRWRRAGTGSSGRYRRCAARAHGDRPESVSCVSASTCTAVGWYGNNNGLIIGFAELWSGVSWSLKAIPSTGTIRPSSLARVSCTLPTECTAVGYSVDLLQKDAALAERWNGTRWAMQKPAHFNGSRRRRLLDVSCASDTSCWRSGSSVTATTSTAPERGVERDELGGAHSAASGWRPEHQPARGFVPGGRQLHRGGLVSELAPAQSRPWLSIGTGGPGRRSGGRSRRALASRLSAVSCASATACTAVGTYRTGAGSWTALAEQWNGTKWLWRVVPLGGGEQSSELTAVSCSAPAFCTATGSLRRRRRRDAGARRAPQRPEPGRSGASRVPRALSSAAWTTSRARRANPAPPRAASATQPGSDVTLAAHWDGTSWALQSTPDLSGSQSSDLVWRLMRRRRQMLRRRVHDAERRRVPHPGRALPGRALRLTPRCRSTISPPPSPDRPKDEPVGESVPTRRHPNPGG